MFAPCRKAWSIPLLCLLVGSMLLAACDTGTAPAATPTPVAGALDYGVPKNAKIAALGPVDLHVLFAADYYQVKPVVAVVNAFMQMYPNVHITLEGTDWNQIPARMKTEIAGGTMSIDLAHQHAFAMGAQGYAESIDDLWPAIDASTLSPGSIEDTVWQGVHYGVPLDMNTLFTLYRKDLFQKAGLPEPAPNWTYAQARDYARKLTQGDVYGTVLGNSAWAMFGHILANGGSLLSTDDKTAMIDQPANIQIAQFFGDLINVDHASPGACGRAAFRPGDGVLVRQGGHALDWAVRPGPACATRRPTSFKAICPTSPASAQPLCRTVWMARRPAPHRAAAASSSPRARRHKEVAFELMRWYLARHQLAMVHDQARYPVLQNLYNNPDLMAIRWCSPSSSN